MSFRSWQDAFDTDFVMCGQPVTTFVPGIVAPHARGDEAGV